MRATGRNFSTMLSCIGHTYSFYSCLLLLLDCKFLPAVTASIFFTDFSDVTTHYTYKIAIPAWDWNVTEELQVNYVSSCGPYTHLDSLPTNLAELWGTFQLRLHFTHSTSIRKFSLGPDCGEKYKCNRWSQSEWHPLQRLQPSIPHYFSVCGLLAHGTYKCDYWSHSDWHSFQRLEHLLSRFCLHTYKCDCWRLWPIRLISNWKALISHFGHASACTRTNFKAEATVTDVRFERFHLSFPLPACARTCTSVSAGATATDIHFEYFNLSFLLPALVYHQVQKSCRAVCWGPCPVWQRWPNNTHRISFMSRYVAPF